MAIVGSGTQNIVNQFIGLFTGRNRNIGGIVIDCFVRENHVSRVKLTEFPIEIGVNINDHRIIQPRELEIVGIVSDIPPNFLKLTLPNFGSTTTTRSIGAYNQLAQLQIAGEPFNVLTGLRLYQNVLIEELYIDRDKDTSGGLYFSCRMKEMIIIENQYTTIPPGQYRQGATRNQASETSERGTQNGATPEDRQTSLRRIVRNWDAAK